VLLQPTQLKVCCCFSSNTLNG